MIRNKNTPFTDDKELLWIAIKQSRHAFSAANQTLQEDRDFNLLALKTNGFVESKLIETNAREYGFMLAKAMGMHTTLLDEEELIGNLRHVLPGLEIHAPKYAVVEMFLHGVNLFLPRAGEDYIERSEFSLDFVWYKKRWARLSVYVVNNCYPIVRRYAEECELYRYAYDYPPGLGMSVELALIQVSKPDRWHVLQHFDHIVQNDKRVVTRALEYDTRSFQFASTELRGDKRFVLLVINTMPGVVKANQPARFILEYNPSEYNEWYRTEIEKSMSQFLRGSHFTSDKEVILAAARHTTGGALGGASDAIKEDAAFVKTIAAMDGE
jgi:hypothetical protein